MDNIHACHSPLPALGSEPTDYQDSTNAFNRFDRTWHGTLAQWSMGISPAEITTLYTNWWTHWLLSPGKQWESIYKGWRKAYRALNYSLAAITTGQCPHCIEPLAQDKRFSGDDWQQWPFNTLYQTFLLTQQWLHITVSGVHGVSERDNRVIAFIARQWLDMLSPANSLLSNPEVLRVTYEQRGRNLIRGFDQWQHDVKRALLRQRPKQTQQFTVGRDVAITPGKVIYRNSLIELIQYSPQTQSVYKEPVLIVPAWIMKYYVLDLSPNNSLVRYLVSQGHTVFMISWKNPTYQDRDLSLDDYRTLGINAALEQIDSVLPTRKVHAMGYCLGGTLLAIAAATMARDAHQRLATVSLIAAQVDFREPGELGLFISESAVSYLEHLMENQGFLDTRQMAGTFQLLRSNDLLWSRVIHDYLLGKSTKLTDLMAWNTDLTRMPFRMHSEYLRRLFLNNDLAEGRYSVAGKPIVMDDLRIPIFCVATQIDHVAPWHSVYKIHRISDTQVTFVLTNGGHNTGIVSPLNHPRRCYQLHTTLAEDKYIDPESWAKQTPLYNGLWWPAWTNWLVQYSSSERIKAPTLPETLTSDAGQTLPDAPGTYVLQE